MSTTAVNPEITLARPNAILVYLKETKYEFLKNLRLPVFSVSTVVFPVMFYVLFGLLMGRQAIGNIGTTTYLIVAYGTFGVMGASLFGTAAGLSTDRKLGWLDAKKATPMPPSAYFFAKVVMSMMFSAIVVLLLLFLGFTFGGVHLTAPVTLKLLFTLIAGSLPFCAMGLAIGYFATPTSAPALINIFYVPMSFCSGLWIPFMFLPHFIQRIAFYLPPYHLARLAFGVVGLESGIPAVKHFEALIGLAMISLGIAWAGYHRDQRTNG